MSTHIFDKDGTFKSHGKNLAILLRYAAKMKGVKRISICRILGSRNWEANVKVEYITGWYAVTNFASHSVAVDWAVDRSKASPRTSWFAGCEVFVDGVKKEVS